MIGFDKKRKTYYVSYKYKDTITGKWHTSKKRGFALKREAVEYESKINLEANSASNTAMSFLEMAALWEDNLESSETSRRHHREAFEIRCADFKDKPIKSITKPQLVSWRTKLSKTDYGTKTKNTTMSYVRSVFNFANKVYGIADVSVVLNNFKKTDEEILNEEMQVWSIDEFNTFLASVKLPIYRIFFKTLFWTGARRGEIIALQCSDLKQKKLSIHASQRNQSRGIAPTKTKQSRTITIDDELYKDLVVLRETYHTGYLFGGDVSLSPTTIDRYFQQAIKDSGVKHIRLHDLRHSHATILINNGVNIVAVSKRLGHANIEQTLKTYTHLLEDTEIEMINTINRLVTLK